VAAALKVAAVRSRAARPAAGDLVAEAAAFPADPRVAAAPEAAVAQFRAARPALEGPVAGAAAFPEVRPEAAVPAAVEVVCPASVASRFLDPRGCNAALHIPALTRERPMGWPRQERVAVYDQRC